MIIVTGGAGLIGSNLIKKLNALGHENILVVDNLKDGTKFRNLVECKILDYQDKEKFLENINNNKELPEKVDAIFHQGACTITTEWDGRYMMDNNYTYSKALLSFAEQQKIPFIYASSAAVYGANTVFAETPVNENPLNVYGYSKLLFDQYIRRRITLNKTKIVGLRYFNVYGPGEHHKKSMASMVYHLANQLKRDGIASLFEGTDGYGDGEQKRDFVYVGDVADVNVWLWQNEVPSGIYNVGTGKSATFNDVARAIIDFYKRGKIKYIHFPEHLHGSYQSFTEADLSNLRKVGYNQEFLTVAEGVKRYLGCFKN
jgi:ADP-L-glycero-D-manno-heptose 6-epimerase